MTAGRPRANISEYYERIKPYLQRGINLYNSCLQAKIPYQTVYDYYKKDKKFSEKIDADLNMPNVIAQTKAVDFIKEGDKEMVKWWLERKMKSEFGTKTTIEHEGEIKQDNSDYKDIANELRAIHKKITGDSEKNSQG